MMKIKNILFVLIALSLSIVSCDNIDEDNRLIVDDKIDEKPEVKKTVLLEEFTGIYCPNCPAATDAAHKIQEGLDEQLVIVNMHAGVYATGSDLSSEIAKTYHDFFYKESLKAYPCAMISRINFGSSYVNTNYHVWETLVMDRIWSDFLNGREFSFSILPEYSAEDNSFIVNTAIESVDPLSGLKLQLWITESKIYGFQMGNGISYPDYEHNHVLRDAANGTWGEDIADIPEGSLYEMISEPYSLKDKGWNLENVDIVGFIYDPNTMEVLDVMEVKLINNN